MTATPITSAAIAALAAYGTPAQAKADRGGHESFVPAARATVRRAPGLTIELSADAQRALISVQSAASGASPAENAAPRGPDRPAAPITVPGSRLNLTI